MTRLPVSSPESGSTRIIDGIELLEFESRDEYASCLAERTALFQARWQWGRQVATISGADDRLHGWCGVCVRPATFSFSTGSEPGPNLREEMSCARCGLNARMRLALQLIQNSLPPSTRPAVYATEQATPLFRSLKQAYPDAIGSEYFSGAIGRRLRVYLRHLIGEHEILRHEDVTALSFKDAQFDAIVSCDVLEHVPDFRQALREMARVTRPGGRLFLTVPFRDNDQETLVRARVDAEGRIEHLVEPEYHGDPVNADGVLAYYSYGWDLLDEIRAAGFQRARWSLPWAPSQGIFTGLWIVEAVR